jgi:hypothetical protein
VYLLTRKLFDVLLRSCRVVFSRCGSFAFFVALTLDHFLTRCVCSLQKTSYFTQKRLRYVALKHLLCSLNCADSASDKIFTQKKRQLNAAVLGH